MKIYDIINEGVAEGSGQEKPIKKSDWFNPTDMRSPEKQKAAYLNQLSAMKKNKNINKQGVAEGKFGLPEPGDMVKHVNGATGKIRKLSWMDGDTYIYFKDKNGDVNYGRWGKEVKALKKGVAEEYDPSYDPDYRPYQKPEQDPDAWKQDRDNADEKESTSVVYIIDSKTDKVVLKFKSTGGYYGDVKHALKHGYDTERSHYDIKWKRQHVSETATAGATSAGNVGVGAVYKNKPAKQAKNKDGTAKNALDMKANLLTGGSIKR